jgi:hypothetical protein
VRVILDRIDAVENKLQFALVEQVPASAEKKPSSRKATGHPTVHPNKKRSRRSKTKSRKRH